MNGRTRRLIDFLKNKYRDDPEGFRELLPGSTKAAPGSPHPTDAPNPTSPLSDDDLAYHRSRLAAALRGLRGK